MRTTEPVVAECFAKAQYTKPELRKRIKRRVMAGAKGGKPGQWSARKAQLVAHLYEKAGGGYRGKRRAAQRSLSKWTDERWGTRSGKPSVVGKDATGERYMPAAAIKKLTPAQYAATSARKRAGMKRGEQFVPNTERATRAVRASRR